MKTDIDVYIKAVEILNKQRVPQEGRRLWPIPDDIWRDFFKSVAKDAKNISRVLKLK